MPLALQQSASQQWFTTTAMHAIKLDLVSAWSWQSIQKCQSSHPARCMHSSDTLMHRLTCSGFISCHTCHDHSSHEQWLSTRCWARLNIWP
jgi:hypothetical protein